MGIFDFIKGQFIDVIEWVEESGRDTIVWKYPDQDREIKMGAQLTVRESQVAIFINEGQLADVFTPGRHELITRNMPILTSLRSWKMGFNSPFKVDVYFVSTREFANQKWGTKQPIMVSDPDFSLVPLRAFGTFNFKVTDPAAFFRNFAGTDPHVTTDELQEFFRSGIVTEFSHALKRSGKTLAEINFRAQELGAELLPIFQEDFKDKGLHVSKFYIESVSLPEEIQKQLTEQDLDIRGKRRTMGVENEMLAQRAGLSQSIPDMQKFMQFQTAAGMDKPGSQGGEMNDMAKAMLQMQMMQQMMQQQNNPAAAPATPTTPAPQNAAEPAANTREQTLALLKELGELKAAGILTEEEFTAKKQELLSKL